MTYDARKKGFDREHIYIVEIDLDYCNNAFGVAPCTAVGVGDQKCYNTLESCQDVPNFVKTTKTYRFCTNVSPHPIGIDAIPCLQSVSMTPSKIDVKGGLGVRSSATIAFNDFPHSDIGIDKYVDERTYIASDKGSFWTKLRARNPNYQNRPIRVLSGYLENGKFDAANFVTRYYIIDRLDASNGRARITAKDPLKLATRKKAQVPAPSTGQLLAAITAGDGSATLTPVGVGNAEYPASGHCLIRNEVMAFTRSGDSLTLTRAQYNTVATAHSANDTVQLCYVQNAQVNVIVKDLLENYANIDPAFINGTAWQAEIDTYLNGLLDGIIVKPFDVFKVLQELSEAMPHYLWWDERNQTIQLTALKAPPADADVLDQDGNLIADSVSITDQPDDRVSTVFVNFGQFDPTKKLDEFGNYQQSYARIDSESIVKYGSSQIKVINSRWISNINKAAALRCAALIGRRLSDIPRDIQFTMDAKDSNNWVGQIRKVLHHDMTDFSGDPLATMFQLISVREDNNSMFQYTGREFLYGEALPEDEGGGEIGVDLVVIGSDQFNINLRTLYDTLFPAPDDETKAKFIIENGVVVGSTTNGTAAMDTGSWPTGAEVTIQNSGHIVGKGGNGALTFAAEPSVNGGDAITLSNDVIITNLGVIGGGGGGGASAENFDGESGESGQAAGGGGAGQDFGIQGLGTGGDGTVTPPQNGSLETGGAGGSAGGLGQAVGGNGGNLGNSGGGAIFGSEIHPAGAAGKAIALNGNSVTYTDGDAGDIRGAVS